MGFVESGQLAGDSIEQGFPDRSSVGVFAAFSGLPRL
jgi:hypothetical protein